MWAPSLPYKCNDGKIIDVTWEVFFKGAKYTTRPNYRQPVPSEGDTHRYSHAGNITVIKQVFPLIEAQHVRWMCMLYRLISDPAHIARFSSHTNLPTTYNDIVFYYADYSVRSALNDVKRVLGLVPKARRAPQQSQDDDDDVDKMDNDGSGGMDDSDGEEKEGSDDESSQRSTASSSSASQTAIDGGVGGTEDPSVHEQLSSSPERDDSTYMMKLFFSRCTIMVLKKRLKEGLECNKSMSHRLWLYRAKAAKYDSVVGSKKQEPCHAVSATETADLRRAVAPPAPAALYQRQHLLLYQIFRRRYPQQSQETRHPFRGPCHGNQDLPEEQRLPIHAGLQRQRVHHLADSR